MEISLTNRIDKKMLISSEDYQLIKQYNWYENSTGYAQCGFNNTTVLSHRLIMGNPAGKIVDHINKQRLDNRRDNLRIGTRQLNGNNKSVHKTKTGTQYRGVYYQKKDNRYNARLYYNKELHTIGTFNTEKEAVDAFDMYILHKNLNNVELNFPEKKEEYSKREFNFSKPEKISIYRGVTFDKCKNKYRSNIKFNNKTIYLRSSSDDLECAKVYDKYIVDHNIPNKELNFPEQYPEYNPNSIIKTKYEDIDQTSIRLIINNRDDLFVTIDKDDYEKVKYYAWCDNGGGYIAANINGQPIKLHRFILNDNVDPNKFIDHIDSNPYNNTKKNLRVSNYKLNGQNRSKRKNTSSQYYGVCYGKTIQSVNKWVSSVAQKRIGSDHLEILAARRRDLYIMTHLPDSHYKMNFEWTPEDIEMWKLALRI